MSAPITLPTIVRLREEGDRGARVSERALLGAANARRALEAAGIHEESSLLNGVELVLLFQHDISCLLADFASHSGTLRGNLYARLIQLTVHESARTMRDVLARPFREQLSAALGRQEVDAILREVHSDVTTLYEESERLFGRLRHGLGAHRDREAETRLSLLAAADSEPIAQLAANALQITNTLMPLLAEYSDLVRRRVTANMN